MTEITQLLVAARDGDADALKQVFEDIYPDLKRIAAARLAAVQTGETVTPTVLVNELYLKLSSAARLDLVDRRHFYACASKAMRQILIDHARQAGAQRRGGAQPAVTLTENLAADTNASHPDLLDLDAAIADLGEVEPQLHDLVEMKFFAGLTVGEIAKILERSERSVKRDWSRARAFLHAQLV
ncbi:MAG: ECF-type sigma factor [Pseudomonadota bacterium]